MKIRRSLIWGITPEIFCLGMKETSQRMFSRANRIPGGLEVSPSSSNPLLSTLSAPWNLFASCHLRVQPKSIPTTSLFLAHPLVLLLHNIHKTTIRWLTRVHPFISSYQIPSHCHLWPRPRGSVGGEWGGWAKTRSDIIQWRSGGSLGGWNTQKKQLLRGVWHH